MQQAECSSFVNEIRKAKDNLNPVRTVVVREDGSFSHEKRSLSGCFERDTGEEDCDEKDSDGQKYDVTVTQMKRMKSLSNRQLKSRLHRQRLGYIVDLEPDLQLAQITCNIFLGSQDVAHDFQILSSAGITHILNCAIGVRNIFEGKIRYMNCDMFDLPSFKITERFPLCFSFIRECVESGGKILVHCNAGVSRSATIVIAYLMKFEKYSLADAINHVNSIRRVRPNDGFIKQLEEFETSLTEERATD
ncbi:hypothetical protein AB6A40_006728 [Gnathostoma spinigerum]|uniref:Dual specificity protein phosphatase 19 n=1 Tax=Gnathostoma spinigerum TaxID=75299 RepID=A0ABD6EPD3_9BILA